MLCVAIVGAACGGGDPEACSEPERVIEPSSVHVLPGVEVNYEASPPTSGPHLIPAPSPGVHTAPIDEPRQVGALETGIVIIQYSSVVGADEVGVLEALADENQVIVAPGFRSFDDGASVAFSAWGIRQLCSDADSATAQTFIDTHAGVVFANHE